MFAVNRLMLVNLATLLVLVAAYACSTVSPKTQDALVRTALDEFRYQCVRNPPNDARLQTACVAVLPEEGDAVRSEDPGAGSADASVGDGAVQAPADAAPEQSAEPVPGALPEGGADAGALNVRQGNARRYVER